MGAESQLIAASLLLFYSTSVVFFLLFVNSIQSSELVDEIFHIPQAQHYCDGNFTHWDSKITTLPGLYVISVGLLFPVANLLGRELVEVCTTQALRATNVLLAVATLYLLYAVFNKLHSQNKAVTDWKNAVAALNLAYWPPLFFFSSFYYTDVAAVFMVLLMFCLHLHGSNSMAAIAGVLSVFVRQTNIVWVLWIAARTVDLRLRESLTLTRAERSYDSIHTWKEVECLVRGATRLRKQPVWSKTAFSLLVHVLPYILTVIGFMAFCVWNGGIVVGDRSAHKANIHLPQILYFAGFSAIFLLPCYFPNLPSFLRSLRRQKIAYLIAVCFCALCIRFNTIVHPYLLADNRHYTFYAWKLVYERIPLGRYFPIPVYIFSMYCAYRYVSRIEPFLVTLSFLVCSALCIVPQRLIEARYFFIIFVLLRLHIPNTSKLILALELVLYTVINVVTLGVFAWKIVRWDDGSLHRIMW